MTETPQGPTSRAAEQDPAVGKKDVQDLAALVTAGIGIFSALAGGVTVGGGFDRIIRNDPLLAVLALSSFVVATMLAATGTLHERRARIDQFATAADAPGLPSSRRIRFRKRLTSPSLVDIAVALFLIGLVLSLFAMHGTASYRSRPSVDVVVKVVNPTQTLLEGEVHASGLNAKEYVRVEVSRVNGSTVLPLPPLYLATQGARASGEVVVKFSFPLPPGQYDAVRVMVWHKDQPPDCRLEIIGQRNTGGCLVLSVPQQR